MQQQSPHSKFDRIFGQIKELMLEQQNDPVNLINKKMMSRSLYKKSNQPRSIHQSFVNQKQYNQLDHHTLQFYYKLFESKCKDLKLFVNPEKLNVFVNHLKKKNANRQILNLKDCNLQVSACELINQYVPKFNRINLSQNMLRKTFKLIPNMFHCNISELVLNNCGLHNEQLQFLFQKLVDTNIYRLSLSSPLPVQRNHLTKYDKLNLFLLKNKTLAILELGYLHIEHSQELFRNMAKSNIISLNLEHNQRARGLCKSIITLNISNNKLTTLKQLKIGGQNSLQNLDISRNQLPIGQLDYIFLAKPSINLRSLLAGDNPFNQFQIANFEKYIRESTTLLTLSLKNCNFAEETLKQLLVGVQKNYVLENLDLSYNKITYPIAEQLSKAFRVSNLKTIRLVQCQISDESGEIIARQTTFNEKIQLIDLTQNRLNNKTGNAFATSLRKNNTLLTLQLLKNTINYEYTRQIRLSLERNQFKKKSKKRRVDSVQIQDKQQEYLLKKKYIRHLNQIRLLQTKINDILEKKSKLDQFSEDLNETQKNYYQMISSLEHQISHLEQKTALHVLQQQENDTS